MTKSEIRALALELGLPAWDKPAMACLASRIPHGTAITPELLRQVEMAEDVVAALGFRQFRVRHHGDLAGRTPGGGLRPRPRAREELVNGVRRAGYRFVTLDLAGFRGGPLMSLRVTPPSSRRPSLPG